MHTSPAAPERVLLRLDWHVVRKLDGLLQGEYRSLFRGPGVDLAGLREYQPGDDVRFIDWNVTARLDTPYVREYTEDREITAWFLLDLSPSMDFGTVDGERLKRTVLVDFVATLARVLTRRGNRVAAVVDTGGARHVIPVASGRAGVLQLIDRLQSEPVRGSAPSTDLTDLLEEAARTIRRRSLVVIVSDFISEPGWDRPLGALDQRHELLAVRIVDPRERGLPDVGVITLQDAETGAQLEVDTSDAGFRRRFADAAAEREVAVRTAFGNAGVDVVTLSTDDDLVRGIVRMAEQRRRRARA